MFQGNVERGPWFSFFRGDDMRKSLTALTAAATIATTLAVTATDASAQWRRWGWGWGAGAFVGGLAAAAIVSSAYAQPYYYGGYYNTYYYPGPYYYNYYGASPVYYNYYAAAPYPYYGCWRLRYGYRYRVC
jgi:hypothetical protein